MTTTMIVLHWGEGTSAGGRFYYLSSSLVDVPSSPSSLQSADSSMCDTLVSALTRLCLFCFCCCCRCWWGQQQQTERDFSDRLVVAAANCRQLAAVFCGDGEDFFSLLPLIFLKRRRRRKRRCYFLLFSLFLLPQLIWLNQSWRCLRNG